DAVKSAPGGHGIGVNYWHPEATYVTNSATGRSWGPDANSLFDATGRPLPAMSVMRPQAAPASLSKAQP
ncbi:MAG TPA: glycosyl hydrolase 53 family protein, partial [Candidatus Polarisedimenticolia bacterium]|nr:glycosyl hydrolase 53 family protein [Candidatus Polarisedimenticolia bacterium]